LWRTRSAGTTISDSPPASRRQFFSLQSPPPPCRKLRLARCGFQTKLDPHSQLDTVTGRARGTPRSEHTSTTPLLPPFLPPLITTCPPSLAPGRPHLSSPMASIASESTQPSPPHAASPRLPKGAGWGAGCPRALEVHQKSCSERLQAGVVSRARLRLVRKGAYWSPRA